MEKEHWFERYRQKVKDVVYNGLNYPLYEDRAMKPAVASVIPLLTLAQWVGLSYKDDLIMKDPVYCVADLYIKTKEGWDISIEVAVLAEEFMEYENFMEDLACKLQKMEHFHYPGEMVQYRPTGETLRSWLDHCVEMNPWKNSQARAADFLYSNDQVDLSQLAKQHKPTQDTYNTPIRVKM